MEYKQVLKGYYDTEKKVKAINVLNKEPYFIEDRPDMKQRIERAINFNQLATNDYGTCDPYVYGCTDSTMYNYSVTANTDDGSCVP